MFSSGLIRIVLLLIGICICIAIPNLIILYLAYILLLESSIKEINFFSWIYDTLGRKIHGLFPLKDNIDVIFQDKAALDSLGQYILCLHPHGLICQGRMLHLFNSQSPLYPYFSNAFQAVHSTSFMIPLLRETLLLSKSIPATEELLSGCIESGKNISIYPGGVKEMEYCKERDSSGESIDYYYLQRHKGFIRLSQKHDVPLVPIIFWNEQRMLTYESSEIIERVNAWLSKVAGVSCAINFIQVLSLKNLRILAKILVRDKNTISSVYVGKPITITGLSIDDAHKQYINSLTELYSYAKEREKSDRTLRIL